LPLEIPHLVAALYAKDRDSTGIFELKHAGQSLMKGAEVRPAMARCYEHPARAGEVVWRGEIVGRLFELHPNMVEGRASVLDLDLGLVERLRPSDQGYAPQRRYPASQFDLSVIARERELVGDLQGKIAQFAGNLVEKIENVRQYAGAPLPENMKSVSFRLTVGSPERTLSSEEVGEIRARIIERMQGAGYELRV
jgi:phenylalanyl-tRNA synthetase beta chain